MRTGMFRRLVAAAIGLSLVAWAPASLLCPVDGNDAHAAHARATADESAAVHAHGVPAGDAHDAHGAPVPADAPAPADVPADSPDCPLAFVAGCIPSVLASSVARVTEPVPDRAAEPDWLVVTESDLLDTSSIFHPPIG